MELSNNFFHFFFGFFVECLTNINYYGIMHMKLQGEKKLITNQQTNQYQ